MIYYTELQFLKYIHVQERIQIYSDITLLFRSLPGAVGNVIYFVNQSHRFVAGLVQSVDRMKLSTEVLSPYDLSCW